MLKNIFFSIVRFLSFLATSLLFACSNNDMQKMANSEFEKRFGSQVIQINNERQKINHYDEKEYSSLEKSTTSTSSKYASPQELLGINGVSNFSSASIDTTKFSLKKSEDFSPNEQTFAAEKKSSNSPNDMFDLNYNLDLNGPFAVSGYEFDAIKIPDQDYYKVASALNKKQYILAGNSALQKNIDNLINSQTKEDIEFSKILIKEKKQIKKQQKLTKIFGENSDFVEKKSIKNDEQKEKIKEDFSDNELKKAIALQVIKQNIAHNGGATQNGAQNAPAQNTSANANNMQKTQ